MFVYLPWNHATIFQKLCCHRFNMSDVCMTSLPQSLIIKLYRFINFICGIFTIVPIQLSLDSESVYAFGIVDCFTNLLIEAMFMRYYYCKLNTIYSTVFSLERNYYSVIVFQLLLLIFCPR